MPSQRNRQLQKRQDSSRYDDSTYSNSNSINVKIEESTPVESFRTFPSWNTESQYFTGEHYAPHVGTGPSQWLPDCYNPQGNQHYNRLTGTYNPQYENLNSSYQHTPYGSMVTSVYPLPNENKTDIDAFADQNCYQQTPCVSYPKRYTTIPGYWDQGFGYCSNGHSGVETGGVAPYQRDQTTTQSAQHSTTEVSRGRRRVLQDPPQSTVQKSLSSSPKLERVFIWDLDETIVAFQSLLTGSYASKYSKDKELVKHLGSKMETMIYDFTDKHFFFKDLEGSDQVHIDDLSSSDKRQDLTGYNFSTDGFSSDMRSENGDNVLWTQIYRNIKEIYSNYRTSVEGLLDPAKRDEWQTLTAEMDVVTDYWIGMAVNCLNHIHARTNCLNLMVTSTPLVPTLAKTLLFGLGQFFPVENIYSAAKIGKEKCFKRIASMFEKSRCTFVVIGDGQEEEAAAKQMNFPFWRVSSHKDLISLMRALELDLL